jgi:RNA polymerase sigma-70 factor, ECF subfamily
LQAAIVAVHAQAATAADTDWRQIAALYEVLGQINGSPIIWLNHAVAVAMGRGLQEGLSLIEKLGASGELDSYHLFHAARADILRRLGRSVDALAQYERALALTTNAVERRFLRRRIAEIQQTSAPNISD